MKAYWKNPSTPADDAVFGSATLLGILSFFVYSFPFDKAVTGKLLQLLALSLLLLASIRIWKFDARLGERFGKNFLMAVSTFLVLGGFFVFMLEESGGRLKYGGFSFADLLLGGGFFFFLLFLMKLFVPLFRAYPISDIKQKIAFFVYFAIILFTGAFVFLKWDAFGIFGWVPLGYVLLTGLTLLVTTGLVIYIDEGAFYTPTFLTAIGFMLISGANLQYASSVLSAGFRTGSTVDLFWISGFLILACAKTIELEILRNS